MRITREDLQKYLGEKRRYGKIFKPNEITKAIDDNKDDIKRAFIGTNIKSIEI